MCAKKKEEIVKLDETDIKILKIINDDVRISYRQISRDLGISVGTVHNRIDKMLKSGVIEKFAPVLNHRKLGYQFTSIIGVKVNGGELESWENKTASNKNIVGIYDVTGEYDAILIAKFKDTDELDVFLKQLLKEPSIERTYTQTVLNVVKEDMGSANIL
ncbi:MAG: Lrp/AsnC family transcriptional regulator [archaeon]|nr:Lrp/AsnC family transcriptional regulator [archaeon]MDO5850113.1 Lrp/AsnC family transcriptional regulator [Methanobacteriaceae archaeon]